MSAHNRVIWSEGLFLQPQHFQQQDRYFERYVETRCQALVPLQLGLHRDRVRARFPEHRQVRAAALAGVFPDGTPFRMPDDDPLPAPIDIGAQTCAIRSSTLAVPLRRAGELDVGPRRRHATSWCGTTCASCEARDATSTGGDPALLEVGGAAHAPAAGERGRPRPMPCVPLAHIVECRADKQVVLDDSSSRRCCTLRAAERLATFTTELLGLLASARRSARRPRGGDRPRRARRSSPTS